MAPEPERPCPIKAVYHRVFPIIGIVFLLMTFRCVAQPIDPQVPTQQVDGSFVREWLVLGPFATKDLERDFLADQGGESNVRPREGEAVTQTDGTKLVWRRVRSDYDLVNLEQVLGMRPWSVAYVYCELMTSRPIETDLRLEASSSLLWINDQKIGPVRTGLGSSEYAVLTEPIQLEAGRNRCLLKINTQQGSETDWLFRMQILPPERGTVEFSITDSKKLPVPDATIQFYRKGQEVYRVKSGPSGAARVTLYPLADAYEIRVSSGASGVWLPEMAIAQGESRKLKLVLTEAVSISGRVLSLDGSPQNAIVVQAIRVPEGAVDRPPAREMPSGSVHNIPALHPFPAFSETVLSSTNGTYEFVNLHPGNYRLRCHGAGGFVEPRLVPGTDSQHGVIVQTGRRNDQVDFVMAEAHKGSWRNYPIHKGLIEVNPLCIHRSTNGLLWVGSNNGTLHSYDGIDFKMITAPQVPGNVVEDIAQDARGTVWIATSGGVSQEEEGVFQPLPVMNNLLRNRVHSLAPDPDGSLWFGTSSGLCRYDRGKLQRWTVADGLPRNEISSLIRGRDGIVWLGTQFGIWKFQNQKLSKAVEFSGGSVQGLHQARDGAIWWGSFNEGSSGAYRFDGQSLRRFGIEEGLVNDRVYAIAETSDGDMWFATGKGLSRFNGTTVVNYTVLEGLSNEWVRDIFVDEDDVLWLANGWGVSRFDPKGFYQATKQDGFRNGEGNTPSVFAITPEGEGSFWVGTGWGGLYRLTSGTNPPTAALIQFDPGYVRRIHRGFDGNVWFGTSQGLYQEEDGKLVSRLARKWVLALASDSQGAVWFGQGWVGGGLSRFDPVTRTEKVFTSKEGLPDDFVWAIEAEREGNLWVGTGAGLARVEGGKIVDETARLNLPRGGVYDVRRGPTGKLWISTGRGLFSWDGTNTISITSSNGLPDEHVWCTARTRDGIVWIGTDSNGLLGYDGKAFTALDKRDGLQGNGVFTLAPDGDRSILAGFLDGGLTRYSRSKSKPSIRLQEVNVDGGKGTNSSNFAQTETGHRVRIRYREIDLKTLPDKRQFWCRLASRSGETIFAGVTKERSFDWVPEKAGTYSFSVQAIDRDLNYSEPVHVMLEVTLPWHANGWILVPLSSAFAGLIIWAVVARALYTKKSREAFLMRERVRIARDLHDHLGARLTHLAMVGDLVRQQLGQSGSEQVLAGRLSESARELTRTMGEIIWATDPEKDTLESFALFVTRYAERFFGESSLRLRFDIPDEVPDIPLPAEVRNSLFMVTKEALNNVAKHAGATELRIIMELMDRQLRLVFEDNGCGFSPSQDQGEGQGLANMAHRLDELGGQFRIKSKPGQGTIIYVSLRLPKS